MPNAFHNIHGPQAQRGSIFGQREEERDADQISALLHRLPPELKSLDTTLLSLQRRASQGYARAPLRTREISTLTHYETTIVANKLNKIPIWAQDLT